jgi:hypothetical protein
MPEPEHRTCQKLLNNLQSNRQLEFLLLNKGAKEMEIVWGNGNKRDIGDLKIGMVIMCNIPYEMMDSLAVIKGVGGSSLTLDHAGLLEPRIYSFDSIDFVRIMSPEHIYYHFMERLSGLKINLKDGFERSINEIIDRSVDSLRIIKPNPCD